MRTSTGIVRCIDSLGRFVIPKEMRRHLQISEGDLLEVSVEGGKIASICQTNELETTYVGVPAMEDVLIPAVVDGQTLDVDVVGGATRTSIGFLNAVQACLEQAV